MVEPPDEDRTAVDRTDQGVVATPDVVLGPARTSPTRDDIGVAPSADRPLDTEAGRATTSRRHRVLGLLGLVGVVAGGLFAFSALVGDHGGANTPEEATVRFLDALAAEDALGAAETLAPAERDLLLEAGPDVLAALQDLDVFGDVDLEHVEGIDLRLDLDDLEFTEERLSDDVSRVRVTGAGLRLSAEASQVPAGPLLQPRLSSFGGGVAPGPIRSGESSAGLTGSTDDTDLVGEVFPSGVELMTVRHGGSWFVSLAYTGAEVLRNAAGWPQPEFDGAIKPVGAATPEGAVVEALEAATTGDMGRLIGLADPRSGAVLYDYAPAWWAAQPEAENYAGDARQWTLDSVGVAVEGTGERRRVRLTDYDYVSVDYWSPLAMEDFDFTKSIRTTFDGNCWTFQTLGTPRDSSSEVAWYLEEALSEGVCRDEVAEFLAKPDVESDRLAARGPFRPSADTLVVVQRDGRWFIHPTKSVVDLWLGFARGLADGDTLQARGDLPGSTSRATWLVYNVGVLALDGPLPGIEASFAAVDWDRVDRIDGGSLEAFRDLPGEEIERIRRGEIDIDDAIGAQAQREYNTRGEFDNQAPSTASTESALRQLDTAAAAAAQCLGDAGIPNPQVELTLDLVGRPRHRFVWQVAGEDVFIDPLADNYPDPRVDVCIRENYRPVATTTTAALGVPTRTSVFLSGVRVCLEASGIPMAGGPSDPNSDGGSARTWLAEDRTDFIDCYDEARLLYG